MPAPALDQSSVYDQVATLRTIHNQTPRSRAHKHSMTVRTPRLNYVIRLYELYPSLRGLRLHIRPNVYPSTNATIIPIAHTESSSNGHHSSGFTTELQ